LVPLQDPSVEIFGSVTAGVDDMGVADDTAAEDTAVEDTAVEDTAVEDPAVEDTAVEDTAVEDTAEDDTGAAVDTAGAADETAGATDDTTGAEDFVAAGAEEIDAAGAEDTGFVQSPNLAWHPTPQCADVEPQYPVLEQQCPNTDLLQLRVFQDCVPQRIAAPKLKALTLRNRRAVLANNGVVKRIV
jgi:hypothetical protein